MSRFKPAAALTLTMLAILVGGCATSEHRLDTAANRDDVRRSHFEQCRAEGGNDCDAILNNPVNSNTSRGDTVREQERRDAYNRCVDRGGSDCDDLLHRD
jgi:hypothetical protein